MSGGGRVSICLPVLNTAAFLPERLASIAGQTVGDWELVCVDGCSGDGSWELLQGAAARDPRFHLRQEPPLGIYAGLNACLEQARGEYVYIATSDDTMAPDCLAKLVAALEQRPGADVAVCGFQPIDAQSRPIDWPPSEAAQFLGPWAGTRSVRSGPTEFLLHAVFGTVWFTLTSVLFRRRILEKTGLFPTDMGSRGDEEWVLRAALASDLVYLPERLATWRVHGSQATPSVTDRKGYWRVLRMLRRVLRDPNAGIPAAWQRVPHWQREIEAMRVARYRFHLRMSRWDIKTQPRRFLGAVCEAAVRDPQWFVACARRRFVPPEAVAVNPIEEAGRVIRLFGAQWPPRREG